MCVAGREPAIELRQSGGLGRGCEPSFWVSGRRPVFSRFPSSDHPVDELPLSRYPRGRAWQLRHNSAGLRQPEYVDSVLPLRLRILQSSGLSVTSMRGGTGKDQQRVRSRLQLAQLLYRGYSSRPSTQPPALPHRHRSMTLYLVGALAGVSAIGIAGYTWYHLSGAKRVVDTARATKERYEQTRAAVAGKRESSRERGAALSAATKEKTTNLAERWKQRRRGAGPPQAEEDADEASEDNNSDVKPAS